MFRFVRLPVATFIGFFAFLSFFPATGIAQEYSGCFMVTSSKQVVSLNDICTNKKTVSQGEPPKVDNAESRVISILVQQGVDKHGAGDYQGAIEDYTKELQSNPNDALAYYNRAAARDELRDYEGAIEDLQQAAKLSSAQGNTAFYQQALEQLNLIRQLRQF